MKSIEVISLIYRSETYLKFICDQFRMNLHDAPGHDVSFRIVANDPTEKVAAALTGCGFPFDTYHDAKPDDYYLNRVYRCWNYAGFSSKADIVCFVNSDMAFSEDWLKNLVKNHDGKSIVTSRLVESGRMPSGTHGYGSNFGMHPNEFRQADWNAHAHNAKIAKTMPGGLYMPVLFDREVFEKSGGFPEGNVYRNGIGAYGSQYLRSGDEYYFNSVLLPKFGLKHVTAFDSVVYHFQSGEMLFPGE